ncbi:MAG: hypothetical protein F2545_02240, partial [Actinobacteria bacterium]|nr:hypothetical protein [Actinomycetota bacterium]
MSGSTTSNLLLLLLVLGLAGGLGVLVVSRRQKSKTSTTAPAPSTQRDVPVAPEPHVVAEVVTDVATEVIDEIDTDTEPSSEVLPEVVVDVGSASERTRSLFSKAFATLRGKEKIDATSWDELEETLLRADIGIGVTNALLEPLRRQVKEGTLKTPDDLIG